MYIVSMDMMKYLTSYSAVYKIGIHRRKWSTADLCAHHLGEDDHIILVHQAHFPLKAGQLFPSVAGSTQSIGYVEGHEFELVQAEHDAEG